MMTVITALDTCDVRFRTSQELHGSDAMNADPDYSASCRARRICSLTRATPLGVTKKGAGIDVALAEQPLDPIATVLALTTV